MNLKKIQSLIDKEFDELYSENLRKHSSIHWTPIEVVKIALNWLEITEKSRVLDIGSGIGKFCTLGALLTKGHFTGVEMRSELVETANFLIKELDLCNIHYLHSNITEIDFTEYNAFYYYNPFCEQIAISDAIDDTIAYSQIQFREYEDYVIDQLSALPINTRVVTYCSETFAFPDTYELKNLNSDGTLALWIKTKD